MAGRHVSMAKLYNYVSAAGVVPILAIQAAISTGAAMPAEAVMSSVSAVLPAEIRVFK